MLIKFTIGSAASASKGNRLCMVGSRLFSTNCMACCGESCSLRFTSKVMPTKLSVDIRIWSIQWRE